MKYAIFKASRKSALKKSVEKGSDANEKVAKSGSEKNERGNRMSTLTFYVVT